MNLLTAWLVILLTAGPAGQALPTNVESDARRERLAKAIEQGDIDAVRAHLDAGGDVNEAWRDLPAQIVRSLLLRSVWYGHEDIFRLLLDRGADVASVNGYLVTAIHSGRVEIVRTLLARGVKPGNTQDALYATLQGGNLPMMELLWSSNLGLAFTPSDLPGYFLSNDITRFLVPKYVSPNAEIGLGNASCDVERILRTYRRDQDGCEGATGPLWLHFVVTGNTEMAAYLIDHGADRNARGEASTINGMRSFTAMDIARARHDRRMVQLLRQANVLR